MRFQGDIYLFSCSLFITPGSIKANTLLMGYKHSWTEESPEAVEGYVGVIKDAFDHNYAVAVLKFAKKLDIKSLSMDDVLKIDRSEVNGEIAEVNNGATAESDSKSRLDLLLAS